MSTDDKSEKTLEDKPKKPDIADFLSAPRRKRKSFVVLAVGPSISADLKSAIESMIRSSHKSLAISMPTTAEEFVKNYARHIALLIYDDALFDLDLGLEMIQAMKRQRHEEVPPVLFLTRQPRALIEGYYKHLNAYHEIDDYVDYSRASIAHILSRVRTALVTKNRRRSRRYKVDLPAEYFGTDTSFEPYLDEREDLGVVLRFDPDLGTDVEIKPTFQSTFEKGRPCRLLDLSLHGGLIRAEDERAFRTGDQFKLKMRSFGKMQAMDGEFIKFSGRIHRVMINGNIAAFRFQNLSISQLGQLTKFLTDFVNNQSIRRIQQLRMRKTAAK